MTVLKTSHGDLPYPAFLPDATQAIVRTIDSRDIRESGIRSLMVNTIHLSNHPGSTVIKKHGGIHQFMAWDGPIFSDSSGFQVFSLIKNSPKMGSVTQRGFIYRLEKGGKKRILTPEKCIQKQFQLGSGVMFCLDYCIDPDAADDETFQRKSVGITIHWAQRCRQEFDRQLENVIDPKKRPLIFAVIQGGNSRELWKMCFDRLFEIGFNLFDCVMPTRDARHRRLYVFNDRIENLNLNEKNFYGFFYIQDNKFIRDTKPVDPYCDCFCCQHYSRAFLHHSLKIEEPLVNRLATIHNLRFYSRLIEKASGGKEPFYKKVP